MAKELERLTQQLDNAVEMLNELRPLIAQQQQELATQAQDLRDLVDEVDKLWELKTEMALVKQSLNQLDDAKKRWRPLVLAIVSSALLGGSADSIVKALMSVQ